MLSYSPRLDCKGGGHEGKEERPDNGHHPGGDCGFPAPLYRSIAMALLPDRGNPGYPLHMRIRCLRRGVWSHGLDKDYEGAAQGAVIRAGGQSARGTKTERNGGKTE